VDRARRILAALWGEWLYGEPVRLPEMQEAKAFAEDLGVPVEEAREYLAAEFPLIAREFLRRAHDQAESERIYWQTLNSRVTAGYLSPADAGEKLREFSETG
jgi:hypothetical protein